VQTKYDLQPGVPVSIVLTPAVVQGGTVVGLVVVVVVEVEVVEVDVEVEVEVLVLVEVDVAVHVT